MKLDRLKYYSKTECLKLLKLSAKKFEQLVIEYKLVPYTRPVDCGGYTVTAQYYLIEDIEKLDVIGKE